VILSAVGDVENNITEEEKIPETRANTGNEFVN
jgi:hypothetical protein